MKKKLKIILAFIFIFLQQIIQAQISIFLKIQLIKQTYDKGVVLS